MTNYLHPTKVSLTLDADETTSIDRLVTEATVQATWGASTELEALLDKHQFTRRGRNSWSIGATQGRHINGFLHEYARTFLPQTIISKSSLNKNADNEHILGMDFPFSSAGRRPNVAQVALHNTSLRYRLNNLDAVAVPRDPAAQSWSEESDAFWAANRGAVKRITRYHTFGVIELALQPTTFWVRVVPSDFLRDYKTQVMQPLSGKGATKFTNPGNVQPHSLSQLVDSIPTELHNLFFQGDVDRIKELIEYSDTKIIAGYAPNQPAKVLLRVGRNINVRSNSKLAKYSGGKNRSHIVSISEALKLRGRNDNNFVIHESLQDIVNMDNAAPFEGEPRLKPYQKEAVGLHLATGIGYLQTCSPGMGKTVIQLVAMRERATKMNYYRGLVVSESNVRTQWKEEAAKWFPEAEVFVLEKGNDANKLADALAKTTPVIVVMSYTHTLLAADVLETREAEEAYLSTLTMRQKINWLEKRTTPDLTVGDMLLDGLWNDICADEAMIIRNGTSKQSQILWSLRRNSEVATALTATPINKSPDDIGRLLSWVRNDKNMFTGTPLSEQYQTTTEEGGKALFDVFGPLVFRRDISEIADEMPEGKPVVTLIEATPDEKALISAAEHELKRCYLELTAALDEVESAGKHDEAELAKAKEQLRAANGAWLGGKQLARMAASDPAALLESESVGAALLKAQGLIDNALINTPTKRRVFVERVSAHVAQGKQVVVFTDFKTVAEVLAETLEENGIRTRTYLGTNGATRDRSRVAFQNGDIDVLICTKAGERGLTLHRASVVINFDLPWVLERIIQRAGRGIRLGSKNSTVEVEYLVVQDTLEQAIAEHIVELSASSIYVLDKSRGVDVKKTETAQAVSGLVAAFGNKATRSDLAQLRDLLVK